jgi:cell division protein FtsW
MAEKTRTKRSLWNIFENFEGDNVVWMIVLLLMLISVVCMFSSTSSLVGRGIEQSRINVVKDQIFLVAAGLLVIIAVYNIRNLAVIRWLSKLGFIVSFLLLLILVAKLNIGSFIKSGGFNDANRIIKVGGIQVHVFEIVKVSMIMYFAWAMDALKRGKLGGPEKPAWKKILYIYAPFAIIFVMVLSGGNSSAIIIGGMMFIIIAIGGGDFKDLAILIGAGVLILGLSYGAYKLSDGKIMGRIGTGVSRLFEKTDWEEIANTSRPGSAEWYDAIDEIRQPPCAASWLKSPENSTRANISAPHATK